MSKVGVLITVRAKSERLVRKHFLPLAGKPVQSLLLDRILAHIRSPSSSSTTSSTSGDNARPTIILCTTTDPEDDAFAELAALFPAGTVHLFRGSPTNIPLRHLQCARSLGLDYVVSVDGDDVLCSVDAMNAVLDALVARKAEYVRTEGLPLGLNAMGYARSFLEKCAPEFEFKQQLDTGWTRFFDAASLHSIDLGHGMVQRIDPAVWAAFRFTLDYQEDLDFFAAVVEKVGGRDACVAASDARIVEVVIEQQLWKINGSLNDEYWARFQRKKEEEDQSAATA
jgi:spore coat polysaccharide biosynthesis protein SpsF (cytidylyltransferase family)